MHTILLIVITFCAKWCNRSFIYAVISSYRIKKARSFRVDAWHLSDTLGHLVYVTISDAKKNKYEDRSNQLLNQGNKIL